jgi:hypothetical protein
MSATPTIDGNPPLLPPTNWISAGTILVWVGCTNMVIETSGEGGYNEDTRTWAAASGGKTLKANCETESSTARGSTKWTWTRLNDK